MVKEQVLPRPFPEPREQLHIDSSVVDKVAANLFWKLSSARHLPEQVGQLVREHPCGEAMQGLQQQYAWWLTKVEVRRALAAGIGHGEAYHYVGRGFPPKFKMVSLSKARISKLPRTEVDRVLR